MNAMIRLALPCLLALGAPHAAQAQTTLRAAISSDIRGLMPGISPDVATGAVLQHIYEGLVVWRSDGSVAPMLAESIETAPDGRSVTFTLRDGVRFHNGAPLTAREVAWTWGRFLDPRSNWPCRTNFDGSRQIGIQGVDVIDDRRVTFRLAHPAPVMLSMMARPDCEGTAIAHPDSVDAEGRWARAIGTGPFRLEEWRRGQFVQLARFAEYAARSEPADGMAGAKHPRVDRVRFTIIPEPGTARLALQAGDLDLLADVQPAVAQDLRNAPGISILRSPTAGLNTLLIRGTDPVLADARVRRAIVAAIDGEGLREGLLNGFGAPGTSLVHSTSQAFGPVQRGGVRHDPAAATRLLREGGYRGGQVTITTNGQFAPMQDTAVLIQAMLQAIGMNVRVETLEFGAQLQRYFRGEYQLMIWNITPYLDPVFTFDRFIGPPDGPAEKVWRSAAANTLLGRLFNEPRAEARQPIFDELEGLFRADAPLAVWVNREQISAVRQGVSGFQPWPGARPRFWNVTVAR